jgi:cytochrome c peroxidase
LEAQVANSIEKTMQGKTPDDEQVATLVAFMKTLDPPPLFRNGSDSETVKRGEHLFGSLGCAKCHVPPTYTSPETYDVGLSDAVGNARFNPPSLRGVGSRRSFFHDGSAASLTEVFAEHRHQVGNELSDGDLEALVTFLRMLAHRGAT